jgi:hypothetical protein
MEFYFLSKIYNNNGVFEFDLTRQNSNKLKASKVLKKKMILIDQNILISIEQDKKMQEICDALRNKIVSPIFYLIERYYQNGEDIDVLLKDDVGRFNYGYKKIKCKVNVYKDRSVGSTEFIKTIDSTFSSVDLDNDFEKTRLYLEFFYLSADEVNFSLNDDNKIIEFINKVKSYDFYGVNKLVVILSVFSLISAGHNAFFYKLMFPDSKKNSSVKEKTDNAYGDIRYLILISYLVILCEKFEFFSFSFLTADKNLCKVIDALNLGIKVEGDKFRYKIDSLNVKRNLNGNLLKNESFNFDLYSFLEKLGIDTQ